MAAFDKAIAIVLKHEGGYVNDPDDPGGETRFGISKRAYPDIDIAHLTESQATEIYRRDYWDKARCGEIKNPALAAHLFDMAVNAGVGKAVELIQKAAGTYVDGRIGPITIRAINSYPRHETLVVKYKYERLKHYAMIVKGNPKLGKFLSGWINRIETTNIYKV